MINKNNKSEFREDVLNKHLNEKVGYLNDLKEQFGYNQELINKLALINVALKENGMEVDDLFYDTLMKTNIVVSNNEPLDFEERLRYLMANNFELNTTTTNKNNFKNVEKSIVLLGANEQYGMSNTDVLVALTDELRRTLTSQKNKSGVLSDGTHFDRSGLSVKYQVNGDRHNVVEHGDIMNEVFNNDACLNLINTILSYKNNTVNNVEMKKTLNSLKGNLVNGTYSNDKYSYERKLLASLLNDKEFSKFADEVAYNGNFLDFYNAFQDFASYESKLVRLVETPYVIKDTDFFMEKENEFKALTKSISKFN